MTDPVEYTDEIFTPDSISCKQIRRGNYEACVFDRCDFTGIDLSGYRFVDCIFEQCNLTRVAVRDTTFRATRFKGCKMVGVHFEDCHALMFDPIFESCILDLSSFFRRKLPGGTLRSCSLREVDFSEAFLEGADFSDADLSGAIFDHTALENADFRTAVGYVIDPERNRVRKAKFGLEGLPGLLAKYDLSIE